MPLPLKAAPHPSDPIQPPASALPPRPRPPALAPQVVDDMNKARTDDLADVQPNLAGLKPKLA